jgi:serine/threonine protein kinase
VLFWCVCIIILLALLALLLLGVLHGDVRPENILVQQINKNRQFSIIDFGFSKITRNKERLREERQEMELLLNVFGNKEGWYNPYYQLDCILISVCN